MSLAVVYSRTSAGIKAPLVTVEVHLSNGLPGFSIVGLAETAVKESRDRVRSALMNTDFEFPAKRITVNLAPADLPKSGGRYDLPIAIGILAASDQLPNEILSNYEFAGELALTGELRSFTGCLPFALATSDTKRSLMIPAANAPEASLPGNVDVIAGKHIRDVCLHLLGEHRIAPYVRPPTSDKTNYSVDLAEVCGQYQAKRSLEIAAAGQHSILMIGPPGSGKSMLASRLPTILPELSHQQALEVAAVNSISNKDFNSQLWRQRPFRAPHHSASSVAIVGGGSPPRPGEISLAHHGVLFLDELPEFNRSVLEALREPIESGHVTISRANYQAQFPSQFQLIAAMNPCPCGYLTDRQSRCRCTPAQIQRYQSKISGPILDRIDLHVDVPALPKGSLLTTSVTNESSETVKARVSKALTRQLKRQQRANGLLNNQGLAKYCPLQTTQLELLEDMTEQLQLSARAYHRILKVARTIADLAESDIIETPHLAEAIGYRSLYSHSYC